MSILGTSSDLALHRIAGTPVNNYQDVDVSESEADAQPLPQKAALVDVTGRLKTLLRHGEPLRNTVMLLNRGDLKS